MLGVEFLQARTVVDAGHQLNAESGVFEQFGHFGGVELTSVERVERRVAAGGEGDPVGGADEKFTAGSENSEAFAQELTLIPQVLDHLEIDDNVNRVVRQWKLGEVAVEHLDAGVAGTDVLDRGDVVVEAGNLCCDVRNHVGAVAFSGTGLEDSAVRAALQKCAVHHFVASEPVVLLGDSWHGSFARQGQGCVLVVADTRFTHPCEISAIRVERVRRGPDHCCQFLFVPLWWTRFHVKLPTGNLTWGNLTHSRREPRNSPVGRPVGLSFRTLGLREHHRRFIR